MGALKLQTQLPNPSGVRAQTSRDIIDALPASVRDRIASAILFPPDISIPWPKRAVAEFLLLLAKVWVRRQRPQLGKRHSARHDNVRALYDSESRRYLHTHARTTCREDDAWRLWLGQVLVAKIQDVNTQQRRAARHLELFAGTGLSYVSQARIFRLHGVSVNTILMDASAGMLDVAVRCTLPRLQDEGAATFITPDLSEADRLAVRQASRRTVELIQANPDGDGSVPIGTTPSHQLPPDSFDVASIMFGLGAISMERSLSLAQSLLRLLNEGGRFATIDMHRPVAELAGRWAWPIPLEMRSAWIEREAYRRITVPYVLGRLWGWHDPSIYPHLMKLAVIQAGDSWYGWDETIFAIRSCRWDFGIPAMPTYQQVLVKVRLAQSEAQERQQASQALVLCAGAEAN